MITTKYDSEEAYFSIQKGQQQDNKKSKTMRYIQTFWTAGQDPLKHDFGWAHPKYNLMSWAPSCLSLREHYENVDLYTDSVGYHILIDVLKLPYTKTHVVFDDFQCLSHHWALAKIKTYSMQTEPFIHVDGDVYLSKPLPKKLTEAPLMVQNRERSTDYYQKMVERILSVETINGMSYVEGSFNGSGTLSNNKVYYTITYQCEIGGVIHNRIIQRNIDV